MGAFLQLIHAAATSITVEEVVLASNPAQAALIAVIDALFVPEIIVQIADVAEVKREVTLAAGARPTFWLLKSTSKALDMRHCSSLELMVLFRIEFLFMADFIMAESTRPVLAFADRVGTLFETTTLVVFAA